MSKISLKNILKKTFNKKSKKKVKKKVIRTKSNKKKKFTKVRKKIVDRILIGVLTLTPLILYFNDKFLSIFKIGLYRFSEILSPVQEGHHSRFEYFSFAIEGIFDSVFSILFGHGIGSFGYLFNGIDEKDFPHNIFLEAWFEMGILPRT